MAASSTSIYAILSDMADVDELITSVSRPGTCSGMATFIRKIATGLSSAVIGLLLGMIGYDEVVASSGMRQAASVQHGIAYIYIFVPVLLMVLTILVAKKYPLQKKEFEIIKKEIARRKGEEASETTAEEKAVCENVTGFAFADLWNRNNAVRLK
jgi:oligogalacturonide transporter